MIDAGGEHWKPCLEPLCAAALHQLSGGGAWVVPRVLPPVVDGVSLKIEDHPTGSVAKIICWEIEHTYHLHDLTVNEGDVLIDIGAHVGVVSCFLGKRYPNARILAFEPIPENFARLERNLKANRVKNVEAYPWAVTDDGRALHIAQVMHINSGASSAYVPWAVGAPAYTSISLQRIFSQFRVDSCRLLKLDCEGAEHEILRGNGDLLERTQQIVVELHASPDFEKEWHATTSVLEDFQKRRGLDSVRWNVSWLYR